MDEEITPIKEACVSSCWQFWLTIIQSLVESGLTCERFGRLNGMFWLFKTGFLHFIIS